MGLNLQSNLLSSIDFWLTGSACMVPTFVPNPNSQVPTFHCPSPSFPLPLAGRPSVYVVRLCALVGRAILLPPPNLAVDILLALLFSSGVLPGSRLLFPPPWLSSSSSSFTFFSIFFTSTSTWFPTSLFFPPNCDPSLMLLLGCVLSSQGCH